MPNFKKIVHEHGGKVASWNQGDFIGNRTFGQNGICGPLAAKWIKDKKLGINFKEDTKIGTDAEEEVMQLKLNQHEGDGDYHTEYLKFFGLNEQYTQTFQGDLSVAQLLGAATSGPGYYFIGLSNEGNGAQLSGHALAVNMYKYQFFDPNCGQATFEDRDSLWSGLFAWFLAAYFDLDGASYVSKYL